MRMAIFRAYYHVFRGPIEYINERDRWTDGQRAKSRVLSGKHKCYEEY